MDWQLHNERFNSYSSMPTNAFPKYDTGYRNFPEQTRWPPTLPHLHHHTSSSLPPLPMKPQCYYCNASWHLEKDCPHRPRESPHFPIRDSWMNHSYHELHSTSVPSHAINEISRQIDRLRDQLYELDRRDLTHRFEIERPHPRSSQHYHMPLSHPPYHDTSWNSYSSFEPHYEPPFTNHNPPYEPTFQSCMYSQGLSNDVSLMELQQVYVQSQQELREQLQSLRASTNLDGVTTQIATFREQIEQVRKDNEELENVIEQLAQRSSLSNTLQDIPPLHKGNDSPLLMEVGSALTTSIPTEACSLSDEEVDEEIIIESPHMIEHKNDLAIASSSCSLDENENCIDSTSLCAESNVDMHDESPSMCKDVTRTNSFVHNVMKSELIQCDPISFYSFLFSIDTCEDDVCSISCLTIDSYLPTSHAFYFHFSSSCSDHISSFSSLDGLGRGLFDDFAGLYAEKDTRQQAIRDAKLKITSPVIQTESFQVVCPVTEKNSRSAPNATRGHFLDFPSTECSSACHTGHECLLTSYSPFINELFIKDALIIESSIHADDFGLLESDFENFIFMPHAISHLQGSFYPLLSCDLTPDIGRIYGIEYELFRFDLTSSVESTSTLIWSPKHIHDFQREILSCDLSPDITKYDKVLQWNHRSPPYILEPLSIAPEPPPKEIKLKSILDTHMFIIRDATFSFKSLKRFKPYGCPFPSFTFLNCLPYHMLD